MPTFSSTPSTGVPSVFGRTGAVVAANGDYYGVVAAALTGATAASRYVGATASGAPASGTFAVGDFVIDQTGALFVCTVAGTPGTWVSTGGAGTVASVFGRTGVVVAVTGDYYGVVSAALTGATQASRYVGATASGAPASGTFAIGDFVVDRTGTVWVCTAAGTPGTWANVGAVSSVFGRTGVVVAASGDYTAAQVTNAADKSSGSQQAFTGEVKAPDFTPAGLTGSTAASRYVGATASGAPASGAHLVGDFVVAQNGHMFVCTVAGTPGTWVDVGSVANVVTSVFARTGAVVAASGDYTAAQVTNAADLSSASQQAFTGEVKAPDFTPAGLTGSTAASRYVGATASGAPASGAHLVGDFVVAQNGHMFVCTVAGTPGTWVDVSGTPTLSSATAAASADTDVTPAATYVDAAGVSVSLAAGTWLIVATITLVGGGGGAGDNTMKLWDGTTVIASTEFHTSASAIESASLSGIATPGSTTTYKVSVSSTQNHATVKAAAVDAGAGNNASRISAIKIG